MNARHVLIIALWLGGCGLSWGAGEPPAAGAASSTVAGSGAAVKRGAQKTGAAIERGVKRGAQATGRALTTAGKAVQKGAEKTGEVVERGAGKLKAAVAPSASGAR